MPTGIRIQLMQQVAGGAPRVGRLTPGEVLLTKDAIYYNIDGEIRMTPSVPYEKEDQAIDRQNAAIKNAEKALKSLLDGTGEIKA